MVCMKKNEAHELIAVCMKHHGLLADGWTWKWDNARQRMGQCSFGSRRLSFSLPLFLANDSSRCMDTVLHEIAHALAGARAGHGPEWKAVCRRIGADPRRTFDETNTVILPRRWAGNCSDGCSNNDKWFRERLTQRTKAGRCPKCRTMLRWFENNGARA